MHPSISADRSRGTLAAWGEAKPTMFIGSSVEGKRFAETIQLALEYEVHSTVWHQGVLPFRWHAGVAGYGDR